MQLRRHFEALCLGEFLDLPKEHLQGLSNVGVVRPSPSLSSLSSAYGIRRRAKEEEEEEEEEEEAEYSRATKRSRVDKKEPPHVVDITGDTDVIIEKNKMPKIGNLSLRLPPRSIQNTQEPRARAIKEEIWDQIGIKEEHISPPARAIKKETWDQKEYFLRNVKKEEEEENRRLLARAIKEEEEWEQVEHFTRRIKEEEHARKIVVERQDKKQSNEVDPALTAQQQRVIDLALMGYSIFITGTYTIVLSLNSLCSPLCLSDGNTNVVSVGSAGTGKSFLLHRLIKALRKKHGDTNVSVTASTGMNSSVLILGLDNVSHIWP